jgi:flagellar motor protein MotB
LSDTIKELSERTKTYQSQSKVKEETTIAPTFEHIRQQRNEVHLTADLNSLVLSLGDKGQRFISFKMADAAVVFAMVRMLMKFLIVIESKRNVC